jgi:D-arabinose 1-dehydrogenase-like Zn-dependent alcohol dehydrogenase
MTNDYSKLKIPMDRILADELEIIGSHGMQAHKYPEMLKMIIEGKLHPEKLIERTISLQEATIALPNMNQFQNKGILVINSF